MTAAFLKFPKKVCKIVILDFVRRLNYKKKSQRFGSWIIFPSSGKNRKMTMDKVQAILQIITQHL
jgi:hypothetical protein